MLCVARTFLSLAIGGNGKCFSSLPLQVAADCLTALSELWCKVTIFLLNLFVSEKNLLTLQLF